MPAMQHVWAPEMPAYQIGFAHPEYEMRTQAKVDSILDHVKRLGGSWFRTDAYWNAIEQVRGTYDWSSIDRIVQGCEARGIRVVLCAQTVPEWARPNGASDPAILGATTQTQIDGYTAFVVAMTRRYPNAVVELWNEPNLDQFWAPTPDPAAYVRLIKAAYPAIKQANPNAFVLGMCFGGAQAAPDMATEPFYNGVRDAGGLRYMDAVSHHPYDTSGRTNGGLTEASWIMKWLARDGYGHFRLWGTECGTASVGEQGQTEAVQARAPLEAHRHWRSIRAGGPLFWYTVEDGIADDVGTHANAPVRADGTDKPVARVMQQLAAAKTVPGMIPAQTM